MATEDSPRKLLFFVTEDHYFVSHRLPLAVAAQQAGYDVCVVTRVRVKGDAIRGAGIRLIPLENARSSLNPLRDLRTLWNLIAVYRQEQPDIVHHVAMKPVLYGTIAAWVAGVPRVVNAFAGMGWLFTSRRGSARWLRLAVRAALRQVVRSGIALVQNPDDARFLAGLGASADRIRRIAGSGVDLTKFRPTSPPGGDPVVVVPARLLWDKGVGEFVAAARLLRARGVSARFVLAGAPDPLNPASITEREVTAWVHEGIVEHVGWIEDMPRLLASSHIVCLPSYREGMPKALIEAAAAARPIVTTDVPGCRDVVAHGDNGYLVPSGNARALADALQRLLDDPSLRASMGARGRERAEREFGIDRVIDQTLAIYREAHA